MAPMRTRVLADVGTSANVVTSADVGMSVDVTMSSDLAQWLILVR